MRNQFTGKITGFLKVCLLFVVSHTACADKADVLDVAIEPGKDRRYTFTVTVQHNDTGWDHYVDRWEVLTVDDQVISGRVLRHPHVEEQPFTRTLPYIPIPEDISRVEIRAHCSRNGFGGKTVEVDLPKYE